MTQREKNEHARLHRRWAMGLATRQEIERCMALDQKKENEAARKRQRDG